MKCLLFIITMFIAVATNAEPARAGNTRDEIELPQNSSASKKKKIKKPIVIDYNSEYNLMVYSEDFEGTYTWDEAMKACEDLVAFGFDDWYLPTENELAAVYMNKKKIGNFSYTTYWCSSEPYGTGGNNAKFRNFYSGNQSYFPKNSKRKVRCVRKVSLK